MTDETIDLTPVPRILRTLGEIPFDPWQCFAELVDNSLDALQEHETGSERRVDIYWSSAQTPREEQEIVVQDNGPGMTLETLNKAARAGH